MVEHSSEKRPFRILFVCTGNTCRSPMAEGLLKKLLDERQADIPALEVASAGTEASTGFPATPLAVAVAEEYGVDIHDHRSQPVTDEMLEDADLILGMASDHADWCTWKGVSSDKVYVLRAFPEHPEDTDRFSIADPIGGDHEEYQRAFFQIEEALRRSLSVILRMAARRASGRSSPGTT